MTTNRINRQQQIQVLIRLKPEQSDHKYQKCAYVSDSESNALVVETPTKKQYFVFDSIADQHTNQIELYHLIGREAVTQTLEGFNCCIFAYGQTGSGKTYSILGAIQDIVNDIYSDSRGILPRLLEDLLKQVKQNTDKSKVHCSYMQIYNEQIFDLLNENVRFLQIREGKKGLFVQNLIQETVLSYEDAISLVLQGQKNRKIACTSMNSESSRSHTIFTVYLESQINSDERSTSRRSKIHIVDLAGSERVKHTNVEGERLKQGCNINKSLHVLGSVINALVDSMKSKKPKHVPFRDSKLTHFLKDSLAGNSITKLLATIQSNKLYLGDTLSTLMFAKRAKIIRVKVQANQNATENYDSLRKEVKRLRQQLAQTKYIAEGRFSERFKTEHDTDNYIDKIDTSNADYSSSQKPIHIFQQNQLRYKALIEIYEQHMNECDRYNEDNNGNVFNKKKHNNLMNHNQWKKIQKKNKILTDLLKKMPAFTRIFRENQLLKQQRIKKCNYNKNQTLDTTDQHNLQVKRAHSTTICLSDDNSFLRQSLIHTPHQKQLIRIAKQKTIEQYEQFIDQIRKQFTFYVEQLERSYIDMEKQMEEKDRKIKEISKRNQEKRPDVQELNQENQYLKLNILELEQEIAELETALEHTRIEKRQLKRRNTIHEQIHKNNQKQELNISSGNKFIQNEDAKQINHISEQNEIKQFYEDVINQQMIESLYRLRSETVQEIQGNQKQRQTMIDCIQLLRKECKRLDIQNKAQLLTIQTLKSCKTSLLSTINKLSPDLKLEFNQQQNVLSQENQSFEALWKLINADRITFEEMEAYKSQKRQQIQQMSVKLKQFHRMQLELDVFVSRQKAIQKQFMKPIGIILDEYTNKFFSTDIKNKNNSITNTYMITQN